MTERPHPRVAGARSAKGGVDGFPERKGPSHPEIVVVELDDGVVVDGREVAREVSVAYLDDRPPLAWTVASSVGGRATEAEGGGRGSETSLSGADGTGIPTTTVATELARVLAGQRVLSGNPPRLQRWLDGLFAAEGVGAAPRVGDLIGHARGLQALPGEIRDASSAANLLVRTGERAVAEAARNASFLRALGLRVEFRRSETRGGREDG